MSDNTLKVQVEWRGGKRIHVEARGNRLVVDEAKEGGDGFRPTELLLGALGACTMGTLLNFCKNMDIPVESFTIDLEGKRETAPERVGEIRLSLVLAGQVPEDRLETLRRVAKGCRVHYTMTHPPRIELELRAAEGKVQERV
ncbi:MAG: OsmC family protein [Candidatus Tectomicrobia bacterium]|uniref:OsmC family protein n=1 Tax=Tectimicrobiota bacterium TaxID=2528274 RepID=A0A932I0X5_UNCTE|nr:OsmC family protein [Candidatus Tectomicrobia bacterium]